MSKPTTVKPTKEENKGVLKYDHTGATFPFVALVAAKLVPGYKIIVRKGLEKPELTLVPSGDMITGSYSCAKYLARSTPSSSLYGSDALSATRCDEWIDKIAHFKTDAISALVVQLNEHFVLRTFLVGYAITIADIALFARIQLVKELKDEIVNKAKNLPHLNRWLAYLNTLAAFQEVTRLYTGEKEPALANSAVPEKAAPKKGIMGWEGNMERLALPNLNMGEVCTRFPPEPSGYMHIGHCKAAVLNNYYAEEYKGKIILRFDDTNPAKEKEEYVENIVKDLATLKINFVRTTCTSDYFDLILEYAERLIKEGNGYVDNTDMLVIREQRDNMVESACRNHSVEKNLEWFDEMKRGTELGRTCVLRAKIDMKSVDRTFRDPAMFRVNLTPHHKTGDKYKAYPLYDFACPIVDSIEGVTHALRSNEYQNKQALYYWVCDIFGLRKPYVSEYSRLNFTYVLLSKRKLQFWVDEKIVDGWNDPRLPTLQGIMRRGLTIDALKAFVLAQGASSVNTTMDIGKLWAVNKTFIEPFVPRYACVPKKHVIVNITNGPAQPERLEKLKFDKLPELGNKTITISNSVMIESDDAADLTEGEQITLMNWGMNIFIRKITRDASGAVASIDAEANPTGSFKDTKKKLSWLSTSSKLVPVILQDFDNMITKAKLEEEDELKDFTTPVTRFELEAFSDENILTLKVGDKIQFERRGLFICDKAGDETTPFVMIYIPDGSTKFKAGEALHPFVQREAVKVEPRAKAAGKQQKQSAK
eukprot:gene9746-11381_t